LEIVADCSWAGDLNRLAMANGITLVHLAERRSTLEEAFFEITRTGGRAKSGQVGPSSGPTGFGRKAGSWAAKGRRP
jgi:hypothetical protein